MANEIEHEQEHPTIDRNGLAELLYSKDCPLGYKCLDNDCMECLSMYAVGGMKDNDLWRA